MRPKCQLNADLSKLINKYRLDLSFYRRVSIAIIPYRTSWLKTYHQFLTGRIRLIDHSRVSIRLYFCIVKQETSSLIKCCFEFTIFIKQLSMKLQKLLFKKKLNKKESKLKKRTTKITMHWHLLISQILQIKSFCLSTGTKNFVSIFSRFFLTFCLPRRWNWWTRGNPEGVLTSIWHHFFQLTSFHDCLAF